MERPKLVDTTDDWIATRTGIKERRIAGKGEFTSTMGTAAARAAIEDAGLKPEDALRAATINAARMIGREKDLVTLEPGKVADLVILDADPLADIRNVTRIFRTLKGGVAYEPVDPARATP